MNQMKKKGISVLIAWMLVLLMPALALAAEFAVVKGGRLNLRQYPSVQSASLGKYNTGTWVRLDGQEGSWWRVRTMDGKSGYMSAGYLNLGSGTNEGTVRYANGGYVNLRTGPSLDYSVRMRVTSGSAVYIQDDSYEWNYVYVYSGGSPVYGYMHDSLIDSGASYATVTTRNGGRVNLRSGPSSSYSSLTTVSSGTKVSVLLKGNSWYKVMANGVVGYISTGYLSGTGATVGSNTGSSSSTSSVTAYVNNPKSTQVLNLRETPSQSARSIGQYKNGTKVKVISRGGTWCEVYVGTRHGYMMTRYLSFNGTYLPPADYRPPVAYVTPTPTPLVQFITPVPTRNPYVGLATPAAGDEVWLAVSAGSSGNTINAYEDAAMTRISGVYAPGQRVRMLNYGDNVCMVLIDNKLCYVSAWNINY